MNKIKFSHNWNYKLEKEKFTTIRIYNFSKYEYYLKNVGKSFSVYLEDEYYCRAELIDIEKRDYVDIPKGLLYMDTGLDSEEEINKLFAKFKVFPGDVVIILTFKRLE